MAQSADLKIVPKIYRGYDMPMDPVCGKQITDMTDAPKTEYKGKTYFFESAECKRAFEDDPRRYASGETK